MDFLLCISSSAPPESCVCTTGYTSDPDEGSTATTNTTIGNTETCEPCDCSCGTPESSTGTLQEIITWVQLVIHWFSGTPSRIHVYVNL